MYIYTINTKSGNNLYRTRLNLDCLLQIYLGSAMLTSNCPARPRTRWKHSNRVCRMALSPTCWPFRRPHGATVRMAITPRCSPDAGTWPPAIRPEAGRPTLGWNLAGIRLEEVARWSASCRRHDDFYFGDYYYCGGWSGCCSLAGWEDCGDDGGGCGENGVELAYRPMEVATMALPSLKLKINICYYRFIPVFLYSYKINIIISTPHIIYVLV